MAFEIWNRARLGIEVGYGDDAIRWCQDNGLLPIARQCGRCHRPMTFRKDIRLGRFRCRRAQCNYSVSLARNTWFKNAKLKPEQVLSVCYGFASDETYAKVRQETHIPGAGTYLSDETIADWYNYCRELITADFALLQEEAGQIGGPDVVQLWRQDLKKRGADAFEALLGAIKRRYPQ